MGSTTIAITITFNANFRDELNNLSVSLSTSLPQNSMPDISLEGLFDILSSISANDDSLGYGFVISFQFTSQNETMNIPFIGLSDDLIEFLGFNDQEIIGSTGFTNKSVNLFEPFPTDSKSYNINITKIEDLSTNNLFEYTQFIIETNNLLSLNYTTKRFSHFLLGNLTVVSDLVNHFDIDSRELGAFFLELLDSGVYLNRLKIDEMENEIFRREKIIFQSLVEKGFNPEFIIFDSPLRVAINNLERKMNKEISLIQLLSIPNLVIVLILLFTLEVGASKFMKAERKTLKSRGISDKKIVFLFFAHELISDLIVVFISQAIFSSIIYLLGLPKSLIFSLFQTYVLVYFLLTLFKLLSFADISKEDSSKKTKKRGKKHLRGRKKFFTRKYWISASIIFIFTIELFIIFEPLFWFPIIRGVIKIIIDILAVAIVSYLLLTSIISNSEYEKKELLNLKNLLFRLYSKGLKKIRMQCIVTLSLYTLLFYLVVFQTANQTFSNIYKDKGMICDFYLDNNDQSGFNFNEVKNLTKLIPKIKEICTLQGGAGYVLGEEEIIPTQLWAINSSFYSSNDLGWEHFIGFKSSGLRNTNLEDLRSKKIIINQRLAEKSGLRVGDVTSLDINFRTISEVELLPPIRNLTVFGIVDTLPLLRTFSSTIHNYVFIDISLLLEIYSEIGVDAKISSFGVNLVLDENNSQTDKKAEIDNVIESILGELELLRINVGIITSFYELAENQAGTYFTVFDIIFAVIFLPLTTVIFSRATIKTLAPSLIQLGTRGYPDRKLRKSYITKVYSSLVFSSLMGLVLGLIIGLIYVRSFFPSLLSANNIHFYSQISLFLLTIFVGGIVSLFTIIPFSVKQIKTIVKNKERKLFKNETHHS